MNRFLPAHWSHRNPIDILGDATPERYARAIDLALQDPATDGLLAILAPQGVTDPETVAIELARCAHTSGKPVLASWMGGMSVAAGAAVLKEEGIPTYGYPDAAAQVFQAMWNYSENVNALYQTPVAWDAPSDSKENAAKLLDAARAKNRTLLSEAESKDVLKSYGIPVVEAAIAADAEQAIIAANQIGYPVVVKIHSETISHKANAGGVRLNVANDDAVRKAFQEIQRGVNTRFGPEHFLGVTIQQMVQTQGYELMLGSSTDAHFGPVLMFGSGGSLVETYKDYVLGLPPLNTTLAKLMLERPRIFKALNRSAGHGAVDLETLEKLLVRFSDLVVEQSSIREIDINPLLASSDGFVALDARIILHPAATVNLPKPAIRPCPRQYVWPWRMDNGDSVLIRPIHPEDEPLMIHFHGRLSERSVYQRYFHALPMNRRTAHDRLVRICFGDYDREMALVAEHRDPETQQSEILAVARLNKEHLSNEAELAVLIVDQFQGRGLGRELCRRLVEIARAEKLNLLTVEVQAQNRPMLELCREFGFRLEDSAGEVVHGVLRL